MDVCESEKRVRRLAAVDTVKKQSIPAEKINDGTPTHRRSRSVREVNSRYMSPTPSASRRCSSPSFTRNPNPPSTPFSTKRAVSAERKRPSTPTSPARPTTPLQDTAVETQLSSKKITGSRLPEGLWPSTMRSLSVSFQSDSISIPVPKKEKPVSHALSDRTLKPSSNVATKQPEVAGLSRKPTPERKRSPLKGKNSSDQLENSRPVDGAHARLIDQHRWPSRSGGKLSLNISTRSMDLGDRTGRSPISSVPSPAASSLRRLSCEGLSRPLQKTSSDASGLPLTDEIGMTRMDKKAVDDTVLRAPLVLNLTSPRSPEDTTSVNSPARVLSSPVSRLPSPIKTSMPVSRLPSPIRTSTSRGVASPSRTRPSTPSSARVASPLRVRPSTPTSARAASPSWQSSTPTASVLSFVSDLRKGKKAANQLEDAHLLRLLHNRYLQWRFANAQADEALHTQKVTTERTLCDVWGTTLELWNSVIMKRIELQQSKLDLKLNMVLSEQVVSLEDWALLQREHSASLAGAIKDLEASTLRLPVTSGAKADIESLKSAISSAVDVMQAMASSISSIFSKVEGMSGLVSEVAEVVARERAMIDECDALMTSTSAMQVEEYSLRSQLIQQLQP